MKHQLFLLSALMVAAFPLGMAADDAAAVTVNACEYWINHDFDHRVSAPMGSDGVFTHTFDMSGYSAGVHALGFRFGDTRGLWSAPVIRYVIVTSEADQWPDNAVTTLEYWVDYDFAARTAMEVEGTTAMLDLDFSDLREGLHTLTLRVGDSRGLWTEPVVKNFMRVGPRSAHTAEPATFRYWIDYDYSDITEVGCSNGMVDLRIDVAHLAKGIHTLSYQTVDSDGLLGAPCTRHFVIPDVAESVGTLIVGYDYWFNYGPRTRVAIDPQNPAAISNAVIEVKDVLPLSIPADYVFSPADRSVMCANQDVFFGIQGVDNVGQLSGAVLSDTFKLDLTIHPEFITLTPDVTATYATPARGNMAGFIVNADKESKLTFTLSDLTAKFDVYSADGERLPCTEETDEEQTMRIVTVDATATEATYALAYSSAIADFESEITVAVADASGIADVAAGNVSIRATHGGIMVNTPRRGRIVVYNAAGMAVADTVLEPGATRLPLSAGIYIAAFADAAPQKVCVRQ